MDEEYYIFAVEVFFAWRRLRAGIIDQRPGARVMHGLALGGLISLAPELSIRCRLSQS